MVLTVPSSIRKSEASGETSEKLSHPEKSRRTKFMQGATVFTIMFVVLYTVLSKRGAENAAE